MLGFGKKKDTSLVPSNPTISLEEVVTNFNIEHATDKFLVVTDKAPYQLSDKAPVMTEVGGIGYGATAYGRVSSYDYNPELQGHMGLRKFEIMRKSDAQIKSTLRLVKTPILAGSWWMQPASDSPKDKMIAEYMWNSLTKWSTVSWPQFLYECLTMLDFGYYAFEKVFAFNTEPRFAGKLIWQKFAGRHPLEISDWEYDEHGGPKGIQFTGSPKDPGAQVFIPIKKLLVFTHEKESGNMQGVSLLRPAYKHWYYKDNLYKVDAIQKERHGIGIPIIKLPANYSAQDKRAAIELGENLRTNEKSYVVLPPMWEIEFADLKGNPVDCMPSIEHHDTMIEKVILANLAGDDSNQDLFIKSTRSIAEIVRDSFNKYAIPQLVQYNWPNITDFPELRVRRIGENQDLRTWSFALRNLVGAGLVTPDDVLEKYIRDEMDLPEHDPDTARSVATPQNAKTTDEKDGEDEEVDDGNQPKGARVGPPRQSTAAGMVQQAKGSGKSNVGSDSSGG